MSKTATHVTVQRDAARRALANLLRGPMGYEVRAFLKSEFNLDQTFTACPYTTAYNLGARETIEKLLTLGDATHE
jgi:hypothetical protein